MNPDNLVADTFRLSDDHRTALKKLGIETLSDLLYHFPTRYGDSAAVRTIGTITKGESVTVFGRIQNLKASKAFRKKIPMATATIEDETGSIQVVWFNQPYLAKMIAEGSLVRADGRAAERRGALYLSNPKIETVSKLPKAVGNSLFGKGEDTGTLYPVYPESRGVTSNWIFHTVQKILGSRLHERLVDPIPAEILSAYHLPALGTALVWIHSPKRADDAEAARKRFAFEEVFMIQLGKARNRAEFTHLSSYRIEGSSAVTDFISSLTFPLTGAQSRATKTVLADLAKPSPMRRLLEGDVGSGKTAVAAAAVWAVVHTSAPREPCARLQVAYMAPTEILARQHFESFTKYFEKLPLSVGLITGSSCLKFPAKVTYGGREPWTKISRAQLLRWVAAGEISVLVGTHALIQKSVRFRHLAFAIIDEQHRFGVNQRSALIRRPTQAAYVPHLLSMTATPIPRTLALTIYGDLDLTVIDEMPPGRKPIQTEIVLPDERESVYTRVRQELAAGRQAYVICPRIMEPDPTKEMALLARSAVAEAKRLKRDIFPNTEIAVLHSKLKDGEKETIMREFSSGTIQILVSTSVVEVGVNVPNATVIIIEGAERFGLAQLHQLRGRVLRSSHQAYCYIFTDSVTKTSLARLRALKEAKNGFELAEMDLKLRGTGDLAGLKQWGVSDLAMEALRNPRMVEAARTEAAKLIESDPSLETHPELVERISREKEIHFE